MKSVHNYVAIELTEMALIQVYISGYNPFLHGVMIVNIPHAGKVHKGQ